MNHRSYWDFRVHNALHANDLLEREPRVGCDSHSHWQPGLAGFWWDSYDSLDAII
jgi:hypothetical protein